jgi:hypothetical protein
MYKYNPSQTFSAASINPAPTVIPAIPQYRQNRNTGKTAIPVIPAIPFKQPVREIFIYL